MKSVIYITATNPRVYYCGTILKVDSKRPDTPLGDMTFQETSNIPHLSSNDTTIVSFSCYNIVIRIHMFHMYPHFPRNIPKEITRKKLINLTSIHESADYIVDAMVVL